MVSVVAASVQKESLSLQMVSALTESVTVASYSYGARVLKISKREPNLTSCRHLLDFHSPQTQLSLDKFDFMQHRSPFVCCLGADGVGAEGVGSDGVDVDVQMESV
jgi:hypothetical protein